MVADYTNEYKFGRFADDGNYFKTKLYASTAYASQTPAAIKEILLQNALAQ